VRPKSIYLNPHKNLINAHDWLLQLIEILLALIKSVHQFIYIINTLYDEINLHLITCITHPLFSSNSTQKKVPVKLMQEEKKNVFVILSVPDEHVNLFTEKQDKSKVNNQVELKLKDYEKFPLNQYAEDYLKRKWSLLNPLYGLTIPKRLKAMKYPLQKFSFPTKHSEDWLQKLRRLCSWKEKPRVYQTI
jgi:hypothetical protein